LGILSKVSSRRFHFGWREVVLAFLIVVLAYQVVIPFVMIVWTSLKTSRPGEPEFLGFTFTFTNNCAPSAGHRSGARPAIRSVSRSPRASLHSSWVPLSPG
jgi:hypothetical protein